MNFFEPLWFIALAILPVIYFFYKKSVEKKKKAALKFSSLSLVKMAGTKKARDIDKIFIILNLLTIAMLITALADPHIPLEQTKEGVNVVISMDVSGSMLATDYSPTRIAAAREAASRLVRQLDTKDYVGIVTFSDGATTGAYLTPDKKKALASLQSIDANEGATALGDGLSLAVDMASSIPNRKKIVVLLSDGVNNAGVISPDEAIQFAKSHDIQVFTIGVGSQEPVILGYNFFGQPQYAELDEATLKRIASETGGEYFKSVDDSTLKKIYSTLPEKIDREKELTSIKNWFVVLALILIIIQIYLKYRKFRVIP